MPQLLTGLLIVSAIIGGVALAGGMEFFSEPRGRLPLLLAGALVFGLGLTGRGLAHILRGDFTGEGDEKAGETPSRWFRTCEICGKTIRIPAAGEPNSHLKCREREA